MTTVHDNEILLYEIDLKNKNIAFHTLLQVSTSIKNIDIIFYDVLAHYFENELSGSIILDICKYDIASFIQDNDALLKRRKSNCWPIWYDTLEELEEKLIQEQYYYYAISASYGLSGWILSKYYEARTI